MPAAVTACSRALGRQLMQAGLHLHPLLDDCIEDGRKPEQQLQLLRQGAAGAKTLDGVTQRLSRHARHHHEGPAKDGRVALGHHHARCRKTHVGKCILHDGFELDPRGIGVCVAEPQDQGPCQGGRNVIQREAEDRGVKAALNADGPGGICSVRTAEGARQMMQQPPGYLCIVRRGHSALLDRSSLRER